MKNIIAFQNNDKGTPVIYHQVKGRLLAVSGGDSFVFEPVGHGQSHLLSSHEVQQHLGSKLQVVTQNLPAANDPVLDVAQRIELDRRQAYISRIKTLRPQGGCGGNKFREAVIKQVQTEIEDINPPSPATLHRWYRKSMNHPQKLYATLSNAKRKRGAYYSGLVKDFALACIDDFYLCLSRPTVQFAYDAFVDEFREHICKKMKLPSYATFSNWVKDLPPIDVVRLRQGKRAAKAKSRNCTSQLMTEHILQRVEADAVSLGISLEDENGMSLGMATVFVVLDCHSRSVLGFQLQIGKGESSASVVDSYAHAMLPKDPQSEWDDLKSDWPMHGRFGTLVTDGGPGYSALETESFLLKAGVDLQKAETGCGWKKPFVERFFATLRMQFAQYIPGYVGRFKDQRELDAPVKKMASLTPNELEYLLTKWIVDEYHHSSHRGLDGSTPYAVWRSQEDMPYVTPPLNAEELIDYCAAHAFRKVTGDACQLGLQLNGIYYNDLEMRLKNIGLSKRQRGEETTVKVYYNSNDISYVQVADEETGMRFICHAVDPRVEGGMSRAEFDSKYPSKTYTEKGYGHTRALRNNAVIDSARARLAQKLKGATQKTPRAHDEDKLLAAMAAPLATENPAPAKVVGQHEAGLETTDSYDFNKAEAAPDA